MKRKALSAFLLFWVLPSSAFAVTQTLSGILQIDQGARDPDTGEYVSGSYFAMGANNPNGNAAMVAPGSAGGIVLGTHQPFVLSPDEPHPFNWDGAGASAGTGYSGTPTSQSTLLAAFSFFGTPTYLGTNPVGYQSGESHPAPTAVVDLDDCTGSVCALTAELSSWEVMWNGSAFEQGPRPDNTGPFTVATGTLDLATNFFTLYWPSQIKGGPFNGVTGHWYLEGRFAESLPTTATSSDGGVYPGPTDVELSCTDAHSYCVTTYYTTDGSDPTDAAGSRANATPPFTVSVSANTTLKFYSVNAVGGAEAVKTEVYYIDPPVTNADLAGGSYFFPQMVTLTCSDALDGCAAIYYTTDGSDPTTASTEYTAPITIPGDTVLKFFGVDNAGNTEAQINSESYVTAAPFSNAPRSIVAQGGGSGGCVISAVPVQPQDRADWLLVLGFLGLLGWRGSRKIRSH